MYIRGSAPSTISMYSLAEITRQTTTMSIFTLLRVSGAVTGLQQQ